MPCAPPLAVGQSPAQLEFEAAVDQPYCSSTEILRGSSLNWSKAGSLLLEELSLRFTKDLGQAELQPALTHCGRSTATRAYFAAFPGASAGRLEQKCGS